MIPAFKYASAKTTAELIGALAAEWGKTEILAGGTDLLALMKDGIASPPAVINIKDIKDLAAIEVKNGSIVIGSTATLADVAGHSAVKKYLPALAEAAGAIGGPQIQNVGTIGGNLCQRTRDWYYRNGLWTPGKTDVKADEQQFGAIFPAGGLRYVHPSTLAPPLMVYGATVQIEGPKGKRELPIDKFFQVAAAAGQREHVLAANEVVTSVSIPVQNVKSADFQAKERQTHDWPLVQASAVVKLDGAKVTEAKIALGHVGPVPVRASAAEQALVGKELTEATAAAAGLAAVAGASPTPANEYKVTLVKVAVKRALLSAVGNQYWRRQSS